MQRRHPPTRGALRSTREPCRLRALPPGAAGLGQTSAASGQHREARRRQKRRAGRRRTKAPTSLDRDQRRRGSQLSIRARHHEAVPGLPVPRHRCRGRGRLDDRRRRSRPRWTRTNLRFRTHRSPALGTGTGRCELWRTWRARSRSTAERRCRCASCPVRPNAAGPPQPVDTLVLQGTPNTTGRLQMLLAAPCRSRDLGTGSGLISARRPLEIRRLSLDETSRVRRPKGAS